MFISRCYDFLCAVNIFLYKNGAHDQNRTGDHLLTMQVLYLLSYAGPGQHSMERETGFEPATLSLEG